MAGEYVPLMLRPGWVLERYFGWTLERSEGCSLKLLARRRGPFRRTVLIVRGASEALIREVAAEHRLFTTLVQTQVVDLESRPLDFWRGLAGEAVRCAGERRFGSGTFVIDLRLDADDLWRELSTRARNMCRRAEQEQLSVTVSCEPGPAELAAFQALYAPIAARHGLQAPPAAVLERMRAERQLIFVRCGAGDAAVVNLLLLAGDAAFYLYGARSAHVPAGAGHWGQWRTVLQLKQMGFRWYDLGQVPTTANTDGIFLFKSSFGGRFVDYGIEYEWSPALPRWAERGWALWKRRRVPARASPPAA